MGIYRDESLTIVFLYKQVILFIYRFCLKLNDTISKQLYRQNNIIIQCSIKIVYIFKLLVKFPTRWYICLSCLKLFLVWNKGGGNIFKIPIFTVTKGFILWNIVCRIILSFCRWVEMYWKPLISSPVSMYYSVVFC